VVETRGERPRLFFLQPLSKNPSGGRNESKGGKSRVVLRVWPLPLPPPARAQDTRDTLFGGRLKQRKRHTHPVEKNRNRNRNRSPGGTGEAKAEEPRRARRPKPPRAPSREGGWQTGRQRDLTPFQPPPAPSAEHPEPIPSRLASRRGGRQLSRAAGRASAKRQDVTRPRVGPRRRRRGGAAGV
jgi:hypothetical protein